MKVFLFLKLFCVPNIKEEYLSMRTSIYNHKCCCHRFEVRSENRAINLYWNLFDCFSFLFAQHYVVQSNLVIHAHYKIKVIPETKREARYRCCFGKTKPDFFSLLLLQKKKGKFSRCNLQGQTLLRWVHCNCIYLLTKQIKRWYLTMLRLG